MRKGARGNASKTREDLHRRQYDAPVARTTRSHAYADVPRFYKHKITSQPLPVSLVVRRLYHKQDNAGSIPARAIEFCGVHPADIGKAQGSIPWSCIGELWQGNSIAVSSAKTSGRTASSGATEPGVAGHASRKNGRRQNAGWFTARSLPKSLDRGSVKSVDGYWRDRAAMCPTFNRGDQGSTPCASMALLTQHAPSWCNGLAHLATNEEIWVQVL